jgi:hypothetical protein
MGLAIFGLQNSEKFIPLTEFAQKSLVIKQAYSKNKMVKMVIEMLLI